MAKSGLGLEKTKALMGTLVHMKPKSHKELKIGKKHVVFL